MAAKKKRILLISVFAVLGVLVLGFVFNLISNIPAAPDDHDREEETTSEKTEHIPKETDIVAEIYIEDETSPYLRITRSGFNEKFTHRGETNVFRVDENLAKKNLRVEFLYDIDIGAYELCLITSPDHTVTVNGNGNTITGSDTNNPVICVQSCCTGGKVVFNDLDVTNINASCFQAYNETEIDINGCTWTALKHRALFLTSRAIVNVNDGTLFKGKQPIFISSTFANTVNIASGAAVEGSADAITIQKSLAILNVMGEVKTTCDGGNVINVDPAATDICITVDGGTLVGNITADSGASINLNAGSLQGSLHCDNSNVTKAEAFIIK